MEYETLELLPIALSKMTEAINYMQSIGGFIFGALLALAVIRGFKL